MDHIDECGEGGSACVSWPWFAPAKHPVRYTKRWFTGIPLRHRLSYFTCMVPTRWDHKETNFLEGTLVRNRSLIGGPIELWGQNPRKWTRNSWTNQPEIQRGLFAHDVEFFWGWKMQSRTNTNKASMPTLKWTRMTPLEVGLSNQCRLLSAFA